MNIHDDTQVTCCSSNSPWRRRGTGTFSALFSSAERSLHQTLDYEENRNPRTFTTKHETSSLCSTTEPFRAEERWNGEFSCCTPSSSLGRINARARAKKVKKTQPIRGTSVSAKEFLASSSGEPTPEPFNFLNRFFAARSFTHSLTHFSFTRSLSWATTAQVALWGDRQVQVRAIDEIVSQRHGIPWLILVDVVVVVGKRKLFLSDFGEP